MAAVPDALTTGWQARLELGFAARGAGTVLAHRRHHGPLRVQRPFFPEQGVCHVYPLHPPGGVVGGDSLTIEVDCGPAAAALVTTPAATKFYRSAGARALQRQLITVAADGELEWLPQEQILFDGARVDSLTRIELAAGARFIGWELTCLGRPASGERFERGGLRQRFEIWRAGTPTLLERQRLEAAAPVMAAPWGLAGQPVTATLVATHADDGCVAALRDLLGPDQPLALTRLQDLLVVRYRGASVAQAWELFCRLWQALRPQVLGRVACEPRIWKT